MTVPAAFARPSTYLLRALFACGFLAMVAWFKIADVWQSHFDDSGWLYPANAVARLVFFGYFALTLQVIGRTVVNGVVGAQDGLGLDRLEQFLLSSFVGAAVATIVLFAAGMAGVLYLSLLVIAVLPFVFLAFDDMAASARGVVRAARRVRTETASVLSDLRAGGMRYGHLLALLFVVALATLAIGEAIHLLIYGGLAPDIRTNDAIGHYVPYFQGVVDRGNTWPDKYLVHFFVSKGAGLHFLAALLTDVQSLQMISVYFLYLTALILFLFVRRVMPGGTVWPLLAVVIYLSLNGTIGAFGINILDRRGNVVEFQKLHLTVGAFIAWFVVMASAYSRLSRPAVSRWFPLHALVGVAAVLYSTQSAAVTTAFLVIFAALLALFRQDGAARSLMPMVAVIVGATIAILVLNYMIVGLFEINPHSVFTPSANNEFLARWIDPFALWLHFQINPETVVDWKNVLQPVKNLYFWIKARPLPDLFSAAVVLAVLFFVKVVVSSAKEKAYDAGVLSMVLCACGVLFVAALFRFVVQHASLSRFMGFTDVFAIALVVIMIKVAVDLVRWGPAKPLVNAAVALILGVSAAANNVVFARPALGVADQLRLISGKDSYSAYYGRVWEHATCREAQKELGVHTRIMLLNFLPACYGMPGSGFQRPLMNDFVGALSAVIGEEASVARDALRRYGVQFAFVDLRYPVFRFMPVFSPESIAADMTVVWNRDEAYLLAWRDGNEPPADRAGFEEYTRAYQASGNYPLNKGIESALSRLPQNQSGAERVGAVLRPSRIIAGAGAATRRGSID